MEPSSDAPAFELDRFELVLLKRSTAFKTFTWRIYGD
jgi:hypothetical protein